MGPMCKEATHFLAPGKRGLPLSPESRSRPQEKRNPQGSPWGKRKAVFSVCRVKTVGSTEETFPLLTLGLAGYGGESIRHQIKKTGDRPERLER
jgi:hypothetical protein